MNKSLDNSWVSVIYRIRDIKFDVLKRVALLLLIIGSPASMAQENLEQAPFLRIEPDMHTASLRRIAADEMVRFAVSAANDKTARVWRISDGEPLAVLRPPVGEGDEGKLFSVAMSPDGNTVAVGGWTTYGDHGVSVYLFD